MTKEQYRRMVEKTQRACTHLPGKTAALRIPTFLCAAVYLVSLLCVWLAKDARIVRAVLVPAFCFLLVTMLRPLINRERPYDRYGLAPVGHYRPGKGKSMPSRHTASAAAIACAVIYLFPTVPAAIGMFLLCAVIAALRVLSGHHDVIDVLCALVLAFFVSLVGYLI